MRDLLVFSQVSSFPNHAAKRRQFLGDKPGDQRLGITGAMPCFRFQVGILREAASHRLLESLSENAHRIGDAPVIASRQVSRFRVLKAKRP